MDTLELTVDLDPIHPWSEILIAELSENGFDSFVNTDSGIIAYAPTTLDVDEVIAKTILKTNSELKSVINKTIIPYKNWNEEWESNFHPVEIEEYATIIAPFHDRKDRKGLLIEILPKMSFGTGHHQTTWMMVKALFEIGDLPKSVLDMGTGTGVLAIVAEKRGAEHVLAVDIEDWSVRNAQDNSNGNNCKSIEFICGDINIIGNRQFGLILANINKNVLKAHMGNYALMLEKNASLILSGFFETDVEEIVNCAASHKLSLTKTFIKEDWAAVHLQKN